MKKQISLLFSIVLLGSFFLGPWTHADNEQGQLALEIKRGFLTIDGSGSINIGPISSNPAQEERILATNNNFQIQDISGLCSGHYTTIQASNLSNGSSIINNQNISLNLQAITTVFGIENPSLSLGLSINKQRGSIKNPTTYIYRTLGTNCGYIGQYGTTGDIKINIPANQAAGTYKGKLYFLLIDNN